MEEITNTQIVTNIRRIATKFSCLLVFIFVFFSVSAVAQAASLYFSPSSGSYSIGQTFTTSVYVSSSDQSMNAASGIISFPKDKLEVISLSKDGSIFNLWVQEPSFSNISGTINFEGIVWNPGFIGHSGKIFNITFKTKTAGTATIILSSGSILANDGKGTNILSSLGSATFNISPKVTEPIAPVSETSTEKIGAPLATKITSLTHSDPEKWYAISTAKFSWQVSEDIDANRISINKIPNAKPTVIYIPPISSKEITDLEEGIWYFHVQLENKYGWGDISHFRIQIDNTSPQPFTIRVDNQGDPTNPRPLLYLGAQDDLSGIEYYEIKIEQIHNLKVSANEVKNGYYKIPVTSPGKYSIIVRAIDYAGNYSLAMSELDIMPIESPVLVEYPKRLDPNTPLIVKGRAQLAAMVILSVEDEKKEIITSQTEVEDGKWTAVAGTLEKGVYTIWAEAIDSRGAKSLPSEKDKILVSPPVFIKIGSLVIDYLSVVITLIALLVFMAMVWIYGWRRIKLLQRRLKKETVEAEEALHEAFEILREKTKSEISKIDGKVGLSEKEKKADQELRKAFKISEKLIAKEIQDIKEKIDNK